MKFKGSCTKDEIEFKKALGYNLRLLCGNNAERFSRASNMICNSIKSVEIVNNGPNQILDSQKMNGFTTCNAISSTSDIYMKGFNLAPQFKHNSIQHTFSHELFHSIYTMMNCAKDIMNPNSEPVEKTCNGEPFFGGAATIISRKTRKRYGKLFEETLMDMKANMAFAEFDPDYQARNPGVNIDTILSKHIDNWSDNSISGYSIMTSITRLMIAAFSNEPNINYHYWTQRGEPMDTMLTRRQDGSIMYANDFLYGMMYDPIHIMTEYDKYMGEGAYLEFLELTDKIYDQALDPKKRIDSNLVKQVMKKLPQFCNKKANDLTNKGVFSLQEKNQLAENFNRIWNSMQPEYEAYYTADEIRHIND